MRLIIYFQQILYVLQILTKLQLIITIAITPCDNYQKNSWLTLFKLFALLSIFPSLIISHIILILILNLNMNLNLGVVHLQV